MKALAKTRDGAGNVQLVELPQPVPGPGEVVIEVAAAGICGTDLKILRGETWSNPPVVLGHEFAGVVAAVGDGVSGLSVGDQVVSETAQVVCGECEYCRGGRALMCDQRLSIGYGVDGAFAEYIKVRSGIVHKLPAGVPLDEAALCEPFAVALHGAWDVAAIGPGDTVLVMGPGTVGQLVSQAVRVKGAEVILVGTPGDAMRLQVARELGIATTFEISAEGELAQLLDGRRIDIAIDCTGAAPAIRDAMRAVKKTGKLVQIGLTKPSLEIEYALLAARELSIVGSFGHQPHNWEQAIELLSTGQVTLGKLVTARYPLDEWPEAFDAMAKSEGIKVLIHPGRLAVTGTPVAAGVT